MTTNLTPLTAADLVVGQSYLVLYTADGIGWMQSELITNGLSLKFRSALGDAWLGINQVAERVRRLPETPLNATVEAPTDREALLAYNWSVLQQENARLKTRIGELEEEVQRKSWRPVSEKPEEGDADDDGDVDVIRACGHVTFNQWCELDEDAVLWRSRSRPDNWKDALPEDQKFAQWKAAASEEDRDAAMLAGWKAKGGVA